MAFCKVQCFVADGHERAVDAETPRIWAEVEAEYADRLAAANWFRRVWLCIEMHREVLRRLDEFAPADALYFAMDRRTN